MSPVDNPRVFISYAWGTDAYQEKVLQFCTRLRTECGIDVIVDKWTMEAGNDTYDFMERCVKDPEVDFVVMLLDRNYAEKADSREGGVGTETQIISPQVYADTEQSKFIPVVFERGANDEVHKPRFLSSRLHFDLTRDNANEEFMRLIRHLYGEKIYPVPPLGKKPDWVSQAEVISPVVSGALYTIGNTNDDYLIKDELKKALRLIGEQVFSLAPTSEETRTFQEDAQKYLDYLERFIPVRNAVITLLDKVTHKSFFADVVADFLENYKELQDGNRDPYFSQATSALLHETFIYIIVILWNAEEYAKIRDLITRTYFIDGKYRDSSVARLSDVVYSGGKTDLIGNAKKKVDGKRYHSGLAQLWSEHVVPGFSIDQVVFADLLIHNISILEWPDGVRYWFPILYVYSLENPIFARFATKLRSAHQITLMAGLFSDPSPGGIRKAMQRMTAFASTGRYRYSGAFESAHLILDYVKADEVGELT